MQKGRIFRKLLLLVILFDHNRLTCTEILSLSLSFLFSPSSLRSVKILVYLGCFLGNHWKFPSPVRLACYSILLTPIDDVTRIYVVYSSSGVQYNTTLGTWLAPRPKGVPNPMPILFFLYLSEQNNGKKTQLKLHQTNSRSICGCRANFGRNNRTLHDKIHFYSTTGYPNSFTFKRKRINGMILRSIKFASHLKYLSVNEFNLYKIKFSANSMSFRYAKVKASVSTCVPLAWFLF